MIEEETAKPSDSTAELCGSTEQEAGQERKTDDSERKTEDGFPRSVSCLPPGRSVFRLPYLRLAVLNTSVELLKAAKKPFSLKEVFTVARALERWALGEAGEEGGDAEGERQHNASGRFRNRNRLRSTLPLRTGPTWASRPVHFFLDKDPGFE